MGRYVTIARFSSALQAHIARAALVAEGITASVVEEARANPMVDGSFGATLEVLERDEEEARGILEEIKNAPEVHEDEDDDDGVIVVRCPRCELEYCYFEHKRAVPGTVIYPLLVLFAIVRRVVAAKRWHCHKCLYAWDDPGSGPKKITKLPPDHPRPVFRLFRGRAGTGALLGFAVVLVMSLLLHTKEPALLLVGIVVGLLLGLRIGSDFCSEPTCDTPLPRNAEDCPGCDGIIVGRIKAAHEHYSAAADERRAIARGEGGTVM